MTTRVLLSKSDREAFVRLLENYKLPCTVTIAQGKKRSIEQNKLNRLWCREIAEQLGDDTPEAYRAYCKLHFAIPILRAENEEFCAAYDKYIRPLPYETKLAYMAVPLVFPATRLRTTRQEKNYLAAVWQEFTARGVRLTDPERREDAAA
jgi:hypothetical protein